jgi:3-hydroxymyristoyl/3-hydroxydecanoyl-(acyl carrier protein) dehydratase
MIATLDMIIKDPQAAIMSRKGNKSDFWAALKLLEKITLPLYFNIRTKTPFFSNYEQVEPVLPWTLFL